jgi:SpoVK/Ycf46/Vps4 family AAA+-type ATPase
MTTPMVRFVHSIFLVAALVLTGAGVLHAQGSDPLAQELADKRVEAEENDFQVRMGQITAQEHKARAGKIGLEIRSLQGQIAKRGKAEAPSILQQSESLFQVKIVPLREQWKQKLVEKGQADQARTAALKTQVMADADKAGKLQAQRTIAKERLQRGDASQDEVTRLDQAGEAEILALQRRWDGEGPNWGQFFSGAVARYAQSHTADLRLKDKLTDKTSPVGRDASRAAELTLAIQRNSVFRGERAISVQEEQRLNAELQSELKSIESKYGAGVAAAPDFKDRVARLVQSGLKERRAQWDREAEEARRTAQAKAQAQAKATAPPAAPHVTSQPQPQRPTAPRTGPTPPGPQGPGRPRTEPPRPTPPYQPRPVPGKRNDGTPLAWLALLLVPFAGGVGYVMYRRRGATTAGHYTDVAATAPAPSAASERRAPSAPVMPATPAGGGFKSQAFAEQRAKHQARYNDAVDEATRAAIEMQELAPLGRGVQANLTALGKAVRDTVEGRVRAMHGSPIKLLLSAAALVPVWKLFRRGGLIVKAVIVIVGLWALSEAFKSIDRYDFVPVAVGYGVLVGVLFFVQYRLELKEPLGVLAKVADSLKNPSLTYVYDEQWPHVAKDEESFYASKATATQPLQEIELPTSAWGGNVAPGGCMLFFGTMAAYRFEGDTPKLVGVTEEEFMTRYGSLLTGAMGAQTGFASNTVPAVAGYGQANWRKHKAQYAVPALEAAMKDVDRLERAWRDPYVADKVFEFLLRRVDLFNVHDPATPAGILLHGYEGNGKAHLAHKVADSVGAKFEQVPAATLTSANEIKKLWDKARGSKGPVVLFVEAAERVFPKPGSEHAGGGTREGTLAWLGEWEKVEAHQSRVWVIATTQNEADLHPGFLSRFGSSKVKIENPDAAGREAVLRAACRESEVPGEVPGWLVASTNGTTVRALREIVRETKLQSIGIPTEENWRAALKAVRGPDADFSNEKYTWDRLVLPPALKEQLQRACRVLREADRYKQRGVEIPNILLFGPAGTGKTDIARTIANQGGVKFMMATTADMKAEHTGGSAPKVQGVFAKARGMAPAVLFIDEIETVATKRDGASTDSFGNEVVTQMLAEMDGAKQQDRPVVVLAATNLMEKIDPAILSRFRNRIEIPLPAEAARAELLKRFMGEVARDPALDVEEAAATLAKRTPGKSGRDLYMLVQRAISSSVMLGDSPDDAQLTLKGLMAEVAPPVKEISEAELKKIWSQVVLKQEVKDSIIGKLRMFNRGDKAAPRGLLLYGPPGTGKTEIARRIAEASGSDFMSLITSDMKAGFIGQSGQSVRAIWDRARAKARCIIFVDECEGVFGRRGSASTDSFSEDIVREFLANWDGVGSSGQVWVIGATNRRDQLDEAIVSRFGIGAAIEIGLPDTEQRVQILGMEIEKLERQAEVPAFVGKATKGLAGRDLASVARDVCTLAAERGSSITEDDWRAVVARYAKPDDEPKELSEEQIQKIWSQIVLKPEVKDSILSKLRMFNRGDKAAPRGLLLYGPPGTGKTEIARRLAESSGSAFMPLTNADLKAGYVGQSGQAVKKIWDEARGKPRCIIFVDECEGVFARRGALGTDSFSEEIVRGFLEYWDGVKSTGQILVVGATNRFDQLDSAIVSRFGAAVEIGQPEAAERVQILGMEIAKLDRQAEIPEFVGQATTGMAGRDLATVARELCTVAAERGSAITPDIFREVIARHAKAGGVAVDDDARWETLILSESTMEQLKGICDELRYIDDLKEQGMDLPRGALLYGPPGTGKTQIARTIANESGLTFLTASTADMKAGYTGQSVQKVKELFERARGEAPCIVFIDEIEAVVPPRGGPNADAFTGEMVTQMLQELDGVKKVDRHVFVLAATNHPNLVDGAVLSRFDYQIEIPNPDLQGRRRIFGVFLGKQHRVDFDVDEMSKLMAERCGEISGRDIRSIVHRAQQHAVRRAIRAGTPKNIVLTREDLMTQVPARG